MAGATSRPPCIPTSQAINVLSHPNALLLCSTSPAGAAAGQRDPPWCGGRAGSVASSRWCGSPTERAAISDRRNDLGGSSLGNHCPIDGSAVLQTPRLLPTRHPVQIRVTASPTWRARLPKYPAVAETLANRSRRGLGVDCTQQLVVLRLNRELYPRPGVGPIHGLAHGGRRAQVRPQRDRLVDRSAEVDPGTPGVVRTAQVEGIGRQTLQVTRGKLANRDRIVCHGRGSI